METLTFAETLLVAVVGIAVVFFGLVILIALIKIMGALTGNNETYLSKSKYGNLDKILASSTKWIALAWILLTLSLSFF